MKGTVEEIKPQHGHGADKVSSCPSPSVRRAGTTAAVTGLLVIAACGPSGDPAATAAQFKRAVAAGDLVAAELMVSLPDRMAIDSARRLGLGREAFGIAEVAGEAGVDIDSTAVLHHGSDTVAVAVFGRRPNWERVGGRFDYSAVPRRDRAEDPAMVASLPRVLWIDTVTLAAERQGMGRSVWKVAADLPFQLRTRPHWTLLWASDSALTQRARGARALLAAYTGAHRRLHPYADSTARGLVAAEGYLDSVEVSARRVRHDYGAYVPAIFPREEILGTVVNRGAAILTKVDVSILLSNGRRISAFALAVAPGGHKDLIAPSSEVGDVVSVTISDLELAAPAASVPPPLASASR